MLNGAVKQAKGEVVMHYEVVGLVVLAILSLIQVSRRIVGPLHQPDQQEQSLLSARHQFSTTECMVSVEAVELLRLEP